MQSNLIPNVFDLFIISDATVKMERGVSKPMQSIPKFVQGKREKDRDFIRRIELETHKFVMKTQMEEKLKVLINLLIRLQCSVP